MFTNEGLIMASVAKTVMDIFNEESIHLQEQGDYEGAFAMSGAESMVNNFLHGRTTVEWVMLTMDVLSDQMERSDDKHARDAYLEAIDFLDSLIN